MQLTSLCSHVRTQTLGSRLLGRAKDSGPTPIEVKIRVQLDKVLPCMLAKV